MDIQSASLAAISALAEEVTDEAEGLAGNNILLLLVGIAGVLFLVVIVAYLMIRKKLSNDDVKRIQKLRQGTQGNKNSMEIFYQKFYIKAIRIPLLKKYVLKIRRRLEINNLDDEFLTRSQTAKIIFKSLLVVLVLTFIIILVSHNNFLLMSTMLIFELFIIDTLSDGMVNKMDDNLLQQQIDFFGAMRHSYHETNMVGEAIYVTAQDSDHIEISRQAENIFDILNSSDPETELEKYYDVAPNNYLKEFAGISYLTQEFGDRKMNGESLYLRNLENITQEMQLEILKRDKLNYTFQSLSIISIVPMLILEPLKNWAVSNFSFTKSFYEGKSGLLVQILIIILTFACYLLVGQLKDSGQVKKVEDNQHPWQDKLYQKKPIQKFVDMFIPKKNTADYRKQKKLLKDAASKSKLEWVYINRLTAALCAMISTLCIIFGLHAMTIDYIYTEPTTDYDLLRRYECSSRNESYSDN